MKSMPCKECLKYAVCNALAHEQQQVSFLALRCSFVDGFLSDPDKDINGFETKLNMLRRMFGMENRYLYQGVLRTHERNPAL